MYSLCIQESLTSCKIYNPVLAHNIKRKDDMPKYYDLGIRFCQNRKEDSINKVNNSCSPACLEDSMKFTLAVSTHFALWISVADIVNCFQNIIRDSKDKDYMCLLPCYLEWFSCTYHNTAVILFKGRLVVQLFNVCEGSTVAGWLLN